jgi:aminoglycoside phosphotransferase (APT) family kinase protein
VASDASTESPPAALAAWLATEFDLAEADDWVQLVGGQSNQTYRLAAGGRELIVRRPPDAAIDASAHNMGREFRILSALRDTPVPVPEVLALCEDDAVLGAPFLLMERVEGYPLKDALPPDAPPQPEAARQVGEALIDALVLLQAVDWQGVGLEGFGRPEGFLERQVPRWTKQYRRVQVRELPRFEQVGAWLEENRPPDSPPAIIHCDFHADNCLTAFEDPARVTAILDWEMATIGDPLLDVGFLLAFWGDDRPTVPAHHTVQAFSRVPGAPSREELAARYAERSGRSVEHLHYFMALGFWKLSAIIEGAYAQFVNGEVDSPYARALEFDVPQLLDEAAGFAGLD